MLGILKRLVIAIACIALTYGGLRLYLWAWPRVHYASLDRQEWREDMEPWEYFPAVPEDAKGQPESMDIWNHLTHYSNWMTPERVKGMIESGELLDMPGFEPGGATKYAGGGRLHTLTLFWTKDGGGVVALKASPVTGTSKYEGEGGEFISTESIEIAREPLITCREGVEIVCAGGGDEEKCIRFYKEGVWYQICGD